MAKRFTDTDKWKDEWYLSLTNDQRIVWQWLLDNCDHAGVLKKGVRMLNFHCNTSFSEQDLTDIFNGRLITQEQIWFLPKFLKFQYPDGLTSEKPVIKSVRKILIDKKLDKIVKELFGNDYLTIKK